MLTSDCSEKDCSNVMCNEVFIIVMFVTNVWITLRFCLSDSTCIIHRSVARWENYIFKHTVYKTGLIQPMENMKKNISVSI